ncbi:hypothetical protein PVA38_11955 [Streptococcus pneumoniae D39]|nr:hypothetical protein PVA38_11955 [Streptococcus pneumoniae D39]
MRCLLQVFFFCPKQIYSCLLYTSDAADEARSVDLGGCRVIKKKNTKNRVSILCCCN